MAVSIPNGSLIAIGSAYGTAIATTILTNAAACVVTATAHGYANADIVVITSGWSRADGRTFRIANITANTFELEGFNTTSTTIYPAGTGTGTVKKVTTFTQISQILGSSSTGGEQRFLTYQFLESDREVEIPTIKSGGGLNLKVGDDPTLAGYTALEAANDDRLPRAIRVTLPSAAKLYYYAYMSINKTPSLTNNEVMAIEATARFLNEPVRYTT